MWKKTTSEGEGFKPAPHLAPCEDCGSTLEIGKCDSGHCGPEVKDKDRHAVIRCPNCDGKKTSSVRLSLTGAELGLLASGTALLGWDAHMLNRKYQEHRQKKKEKKEAEEGDNEKEASIKRADADVIQFPTFDDETHERITNAINGGHICHFGMIGCGYNKGYIEGQTHPELAHPDCVVHGSGGAMERHPAGTGKGDRKLDEESTELADVIPIKRKGNVMSNEFNNRQDEDSFGLWYDEDIDGHVKEAWFGNPMNLIRGLSGEDSATRDLASAEQNAMNVEQGQPYTPIAEQAQMPVSEEAEVAAGASPSPKSDPVVNTVNKAQERNQTINQLIKSTSVQEIPKWIEDARQIIATDLYDQDEEVNQRIDDKKLERSEGEDSDCDQCGGPYDEHCEDCETCPGDPHAPGCSKSDEDYDDYNDSMDGDFDSAMTSAGFGTDEDYGYYGGDEW